MQSSISIVQSNFEEREFVGKLTWDRLSDGLEGIGTYSVTMSSQDNHFHNIDFVFCSDVLKWVDANCWWTMVAVLAS